MDSSLWRRGVVNDNAFLSLLDDLIALRVCIANGTAWHSLWIYGVIVYIGVLRCYSSVGTKRYVAVDALLHVALTFSYFAYANISLSKFTQANLILSR